MPDDRDEEEERGDEQEDLPAVRDEEDTQEEEPGERPAGLQGADGELGGAGVRFGGPSGADSGQKGTVPAEQLGDLRRHLRIDHHMVHRLAPFLRSPR
nr:hypothetical protein GCM10020093_035240 [Planobispora longispora]